MQRLDAMRAASTRLMGRERLDRDVFGRGDPEPLAHSERVRSHRIVGPVSQPCGTERPLDAVSSDPVQPRQQRKVAPPCERRRKPRRLDQGSDPADHAM